MIQHRRNGYYYIEGLELPSITTILQIINKPALLFWYAREATRIALKEPQLNEKEVLAKLQLYVASTQERGHYVHNVAEEMPNIDVNKINPMYKGYVDALVKWWAIAKPEIIGREVEAHSIMYKYGCRVDCICKLNGEVWIIDFKTTTRSEIYKEVGLQLLAGEIALIEQGIADVKHTGVVSLNETGEWLFKETNDQIDDLKALLQMYDWLKRKGE